MNLPHGSVCTHGNQIDARQHSMPRQRSQSARQRFHATAETLPSVSGTTHGNKAVAGDDTAVRSLLSVDARQSRCRAYWALCRARMSHGKATISGSVASGVFFATNGLLVLHLLQKKKDPI
jgi:hypothetical protein